VNNSIVVVVLASAVAYGTPLLYAALGELLAERSGVLNLGVEGMMLVGAVMGFLAVQRVGGPAGVVLPAAIAVAALAGGVLALAVALRRNQARTALRQVVVFARRRPSVTADPSKPAAPVSVGSIPYGVAIGAATWICLLGGGPF